MLAFTFQGQHSIPSIFSLIRFTAFPALKQLLPLFSFNSVLMLIVHALINLQLFSISFPFPFTQLYVSSLVLLSLSDHSFFSH